MDEQVVYCRDCNREFLFTVGEQEFYARHGLTNPPSRCPDCRAARKRSNDIPQGEHRMAQSNGARMLYPAICANCRRPTHVPFQPKAGGRPVYCQDCYQLRNAHQQRPHW